MTDNQFAMGVTFTQASFGGYAHVVVNVLRVESNGAVRGFGAGDSVPPRFILGGIERI